MIEADLPVINALGLHARAAAKLVHEASRFVCSVKLSKGGTTVEGKSILGVLLLAAPQGSQVTVRCDGTDEEAAIEALRDLFARGFNELEQEA